MRGTASSAKYSMGVRCNPRRAARRRLDTDHRLYIACSLPLCHYSIFLASTATTPDLSLLSLEYSPFDMADDLGAACCGVFALCGFAALATWCNGIMPRGGCCCGSCCTRSLNEDSWEKELAKDRAHLRDSAVLDKDKIPKSDSPNAQPAPVEPMARVRDLLYGTFLGSLSLHDTISWASPPSFLLASTII
uniref:Uncharacterized protein n=1 Tax=Mycena chlorophos TaxID=658473 RepID=A0ABQ0L4M8_MYCCL|nr:predicted protein [Mycena chlorophos]